MVLVLFDYNNPGVLFSEVDFLLHELLIIEPQTSKNVKISYADIFSDAVCQGHRGHIKTKVDSHTKLIMDNWIFQI